MDRLDVVYTGPDMSFYCAIRAFKWTGHMLSIPGRTCHFTASSGILYGLLQRLIENVLKKALLIIPLPGSRLSPI